MIAVDSSALIPLAWVGRLNLISATFEEIQTTPLVENKVLVDGSGAVVASQRQSVPPAETVDGQRVPVYEQVDLRVPGLSTGDTVTVELVPDVSNPRQEGLNYLDTARESRRRRRSRRLPVASPTPRCSRR